jgi:hypothetical protein
MTGCVYVSGLDMIVIALTHGVTTPVLAGSQNVW